jgi:FkbM family methyltransferase
MSIVSYAQNFEDVMLWRALGDIPNGYYIDIGAQDPVVDSVSKAFYEHAWCGMHVEPTSVYSNRIRNDRPNDIVLQVALNDEPGLLAFYEIPDTGLSTGDLSIAEHHRSQGYKVVETVVPCITLADVFAQVGIRTVHWLKIDVEGMEAKVLNSWGECPLRPWILVIESTYPNSRTETHREWEHMVLTRGYVCAYFDGLSRFYVLADKPDLLKKFNVPPNIFDNFSMAVSVPYNARTLSAIQKDQQLFYEEKIKQLSLESADREIKHAQHLQAEQKEQVRIQEDHKKYELKLAEQILAMQRQTETLLRMQVQREQAIAKQQQQLEQSQATLRNFQIEKTAKELDFGEKLLAHQNHIAKQEQHHAQQMADLTQRLDSTRIIAAQRELDLKEETQTDALLAKQQFIDQIRALTEREQTLHLSHEKSEASVLQRLNSSEQLRLKLVASRDAIESAFTQERASYINDLKLLSSIVAKQNSALVRKQSSLWQQYFSPFNTFRQGLETKQKMNLESITTMQLVYQIAYQPVFKVKSDGIYNLDDFQHLYDRNFVHAAYISILRREPDQAGETYYLERIRKGISKNKILAQFQKSSEAEMHKTYIAGLKSAVVIENICEIPVIGRILVALSFLSNIKNHLQDLRALENHIVRMAEETQLSHQNDIAKIRAVLTHQK